MLFLKSTIDLFLRRLKEESDFTPGKNNVLSVNVNNPRIFTVIHGSLKGHVSFFNIKIFNSSITPQLTEVNKVNKV